jgi:gliding motility-associated-like protein
VAPTATADSYTVYEDATLNKSGFDGVLFNDNDGDGDAISVIGIRTGIITGTGTNGILETPLAGTFGQLTISSNGSIYYDANNANQLTESQSVSDHFTYKISDGNGGESSANLTINLIGRNDAPKVSSTAITEFEGKKNASLGLNTPTDVDNNISQLSIKVLTLPLLGNITKANGNVLSLNEILTDVELIGLVYNAPLQYNGTDIVGYFEYSVSDPFVTVKGKVDITLIPVNDNPVFNDITNPTFISATKSYKIITPEDTPISNTVKATDIDGDALNYTKGTSPAKGNVTVNTNGSYTYTPNLNYFGNDSFTINVSDGKGGTASTAVAVEVTPVNDIPVFNDPTNPGFNTTSKNYLFTTPEDTPISNSVKATDADEDPITYSKGTNPINGNVTVTTSGLFTYTPNLNYNGSETFTIMANDGKGGSTSTTVTITVSPVNDNPVYNDPSNLTFNPTTKNYSITTPENISINNAVKATDVDGDALIYTKGTNPLNGTISVNSNGNYTYNPNPSFNGNDSFTILVSDGNGGSATTTVSVVVTQVNDSPEFNDPTNPAFNITTKNYSVTTPEDTPFNGSVKATDADGDALTYSKGTNPTNGNVTVNANGNYTYIPNANYNGNESFTIIVTDGKGGTATTTVFIIVTPVNDNPIYNDPTNPSFNSTTKNYSITTPEDTPISNTVKATDIEELVLTYSKGTNPTNGAVVVTALGTYTYTPNLNFNGDDSFTIIVSDGKDGSATTTVSVKVTPVNDFPEFNDKTNPNFNPLNKTYSITTPEDTPKSDFVKATDIDADELTYTKLTNPTNGSVNVKTDGTYTYTPNLNYNGADSFTIQVNDGKGGTAITTVNITVTPVNDNPEYSDETNPNFNITTKNYSITTPEDTSISGSVKAIDSDGDAITFTKGTNPLKGVVLVNVDGTYTYTPNLNYNGNDSFTILANDGKGGTATTTVSVIVTPVNDNPIFTDITNPNFNPTTKNYYFKTPVNISIIASIKANDIDGDPLSYSKATNPTKGNVTVNTSGVFTYAPNANYTGNDSFTVTVSDGNGGTVNSIVDIYVYPIPVFTKKSSTPIINADGTFSMNYTILINNNSDQRFDSIQVKDDLDLVFNNDGCAYKLNSILVSGNLISNTIYNGSSNIELLDKNRSFMLPNTKDSITINLNVENPNRFYGNVFNQATLFAHSSTKDYYLKNILSDDISIVGAENPTLTKIPQTELFIPDGFSPNGDGINEVFQVQFLNTYTLSLEVYNRWGNVVYENVNYNNEWDGKGTGNFLGKDLPGGTYYCVYKLIETSNGDVISNGVKYITLRR